MSVELIHIEIYQSRHFSFSLILFGALGVYVYTTSIDMKINITSALAQSTL